MTNEDRGREWIMEHAGSTLSAELGKLLAVVDAARTWRKSLIVQGGVSDSWTAETKALVLGIDALDAKEAT